MVEPISPRFASAIVTIFACRANSSVSSNTAKPADPNRSYSATWGFRAATPVVSAAASTIVFENVARPAGSLVRPQACSNSVCGSMPKHNGPCWTIDSAKRAPNDCDIVVLPLAFNHCGKTAIVFLQTRDIPGVLTLGLYRLQCSTEGCQRGHNRYTK